MIRIRKKLSLATSILLIFLLLFATACKDKKISVEDYPEPESVVKEEKERQEYTSEADLSGAMTDEEFEEFIANPDPFEKNGNFIYNPANIPENLCRKYRDNPKVIANARHILCAIYNFDSEFEIPTEDVLSAEEFFLAYELACEASPMTYGATVDSEDYQHFTVSYLPSFTVYQEDDGSFTAETIENDNPAHAKEVFEGFIEYVTSTINKNVDKDAPQMEKAKAVYRALANDFTIDWDLFGMSLVESDDFTDGSVDIISKNTLIEGVWEKKLDQYQLALFYQFMMYQLNIECMCVSGSGTYHKKNIEELDNYMADLWQNTWNVVVSDGKAYNCDLFMEIAVLENRKITNPGSEADLTYFGMSDDTHDKTYTVNKASLKTYSTYYGYGAVDGVEENKVPECVEDYYF